MALSRRGDVMVAGGIALLLPVIVLLSGDPLYIGLWYYLIIPAFVIGWGVLLRAPPPYQAGAAVAVAGSFLVYMSFTWFAARPDGMIGLAHLMSLPGGLIGYFTAMKFARRSSRATSILALGLLGWSIGFVINNRLLPLLL